MVQSRNPLQRSDFYTPARETHWHAVDRIFIDPQDGRFPASQSPPCHPRALSIEAALRDCVRLPVKDFALIVHLENGDEKTYTSQTLTPSQSRIFTSRFRQDFRRNVRRSNGKATNPGSAYQDEKNFLTEFDTDDNRKLSLSGESSCGGRSRRRYHGQSRSEESDETDSVTSKRKRVRGTQFSSFDNDDTPVPVPVVKAQQLTIGNEAEVESFYYTRFKDMQQASCKVMGKAFVKLVEPKKQTHHPYTKGEDNVPPWWPKAAGDSYVRHKEPDHLLRPERIRLLVHILKMVIEPYEKQCPTVQKLRLNVAKLEEATMEAMASWFNDDEHPDNLLKKPFLKEIFKVAKAEERCKNGEIDKDTRVPVMYGDRSGVDYSDDEAEKGVKDEDEESDMNQIPTNTPNADSMASQPMMQTEHLQQEQEPNNMFMGSTRHLPMRYHTHPGIVEQTPFPNSSFLQPRIGVGFQSQSPNPQDPTRRPFGSPVYPSPQSIYGWQNTAMASNGTINSADYVTSPQTSFSSQGGPFQLPPPPITQQPMLPPMVQHDFDGLPAGRQFDSGPAIGSIVRTGSLGHPHHIPHGFPNYIHNGGYGGNDSVVTGTDEHHQIHHN